MNNRYSNFDNAYKGNRYNTTQKLETNGYNYKNYAEFNNIPPEFGKTYEAFYDRGIGVPKIDDNNMTVQDIFRTPFLFLQEHRKNYSNVANTALKGIQTESELSKIFFSDENFKRVQKLLRKEIYRRTNGQYKLEIDQEQKDLFIAMRAIYLEHARFLPGQIVRQVKRLNKKVVDEVVPGMITGIKQYWGYLKEINKPISPIDRPMNVNNAGRRQLPSVTTTWN